MNARPWMTKDGLVKSDDEIREISKNWSKETWEEFLIENSDEELSESSLDCGDDIEFFTDEITIEDLLLKAEEEEKNDNFENDNFSMEEIKLRRKLKNTIRQLPGKEYRVLKMHYLDNLTDIQAGRLLGIADRTVNYRREIAKQKIYKTFFQVTGKNSKKAPHLII